MLTIPQTKEYTNDLLAFINVTNTSSMDEVVAAINSGKYKFDFILIKSNTTQEKEWKLVIKKA